MTEIDIILSNVETAHTVTWWLSAIALGFVLARVWAQVQERRGPTRRSDESVAECTKSSSYAGVTYRFNSFDKNTQWTFSLRDPDMSAVNAAMIAIAAFNKGKGGATLPPLMHSSYDIREWYVGPRRDGEQA